MMKIIGLLYLSIAIVRAIQVGVPPNFETGAQDTQMNDVIYGIPKVNSSEFKTKEFTQKIDHFNKTDNRTFQMRYFINSKHFNKDEGPLFLYLCGEYACQVHTTKMFPYMVGASHKANLVTLEHRYYGVSQPFGDWSTASLKYLTTDQALEDIASFVRMINKDKPDRKTIVIGGSYSGGLASWFRGKYPSLAIAAWSSSGVVYPKADLWEYDQHIYSSTVKSGKTCPDTINSIFKKVEAALVSPKRELRNSLLTAMGADTAINNGDFAFFFADQFVEHVQYGNRTFLCQMMEKIKNDDLIKQVS